jgi:hypothetical protein
MAKEKDVEDYKHKIEEKLEDLIKRREKLVLDLRETQREVENFTDMLYAMDLSKQRIVCPTCRSTGIITTQDGKKHYCDVCGGPDRPYLWADKYTFAPVKKPEKDD